MYNRVYDTYVCIYIICIYNICRHPNVGFSSQLKRSKPAASIAIAAVARFGRSPGSGGIMQFHTDILGILLQLGLVCGVLRENMGFKQQEFGGNFSKTWSGCIWCISQNWKKMTYFNGENDDTSKALDSGVPVLDWLRSGWKHHLKWSNDVLVDRSPIKRCHDLHFGESSIKVLGPKKMKKGYPLVMSK